METKTPDRWQSRLSAALAAATDDPTARFAQLATVGADGTPFNRTVVVREFDAETGDLWIVTDGRSQKVAQIRADSRVALCWYLGETREQFRFRAAATLVDGTVQVEADRTARRAAWTALSSRTQRQFVWPEPRAPREPNTARSARHLRPDRVPPGLRRLPRSQYHPPPPHLSHAERRWGVDPSVRQSVTRAPAPPTSQREGRRCLVTLDCVFGCPNTG